MPEYYLLFGKAPVISEKLVKMVRPGFLSIPRIPEEKTRITLMWKIILPVNYSENISFRSVHWIQLKRKEDLRLNWQMIV